MHLNYYIIIIIIIIVCSSGNLVFQNNFVSQQKLIHKQVKAKRRQRDIVDSITTPASVSR